MEISLAAVRVLIVDDEPAVRSVVDQLLRAWGCVQVEAANNGKEAVQRYSILRPHVVLMDVEMPEMNGHDASRAIVEMDPGARILLLTGIPDGDLALRALEQGLVKLVLPKPFQFQQLKMAMTEILRDAPIPSAEEWGKREAVA